MDSLSKRSSKDSRAADSITTSIQQPIMKFTTTSILGFALCQSLASAIPQPLKVQSRQAIDCSGTPSGTNTADNRQCWGPDFSIDTDWYENTPVTQYTADNPREVSKDLYIFNTTNMETVLAHC
jgi:hypothetical protein